MHVSCIPAYNSDTRDEKSRHDLKRKTQASQGAANVLSAASAASALFTICLT